LNGVLLKESKDLKGIYVPFEGLRDICSYKREVGSFKSLVIVYAEK